MGIEAGVVSSVQTQIADDGRQGLGLVTAVAKRAAPAVFVVQPLQPKKADTPRLILDELPFLRRVAGRWQARGADRDDLVQDTLVRALASAHHWQPGSNLRAWLVTILRNQFLADLAKSGRAADAHRIYADAMGRASDGDDYARLMLRDVDRSLRRMPNAQRQAIMLVGLEGKSYDEVAQTMGVTADSVRSHLARARQYLREAVQSGRSTSPIGGRSTRALRIVSVK